MLNAQIPHPIDGQVVVQGMKKLGLQTQTQIIVSRKDVSNRFNLSLGSKYMESQSKLNGKMVKWGFRRDQFYDTAEKRLDSMFKYKRNFVESYQARKTYIHDPQIYFAHL